MINVYVVSLESDVNKRETISSLLESYDIDFEFVEAVYGRDIEIDNLNEMKSKFIEYGREIGPGEVGCFLSHIRTYEKIISQDNNWAIILEDDVFFDVRFKNFIDGFSDKELMEDNLYILGGQEGLVSEPMQVKSLFRNSMIGNAKFRKTINSSKYIYRTCCYLMNKKMAKKILELVDRKYYLIDDWYFLSQTKTVNDIYLSDLVSHPLDLSNSLIQQERCNGIKSSLFSKIKSNSSLRYFYSRLRKILSFSI
ncbi:hypothetical protein VH1709_contig00033-0165 [Vibrio harveyi]|uniref:glycosyltransferase family 25 protein n=1 Tax=Vibrio harveyi TaxID=669 RepID=UPI000C7AFC7C|nr:glycosyltransferase family 25 protein [Vibrio harveyi]AWA98778.1 hypothetical protein CU052_04985 [Vibrio harveyi]GBK99351.1 hypothetical protein VH1709_contig00033-0165 [Vibrio harveyi]